MPDLKQIHNKETDISEKVSRLIGEQKISVAINYLLRVIEDDNDNTQAKVLLEQIKKINQFQNREIYAQTNLDMDPWLE